MIRLRGKIRMGGKAMGIAVVVHSQGGLPILPPSLLLALDPNIKRRDDDPCYVLIADSFEAVQALCQTDLPIAGILCEQASHPQAPGRLSLVLGIDRLLQTAQEGCLVLIDGETGVVILDPDSLSMAQFQADSVKLAPRNRYFIDFDHQAARTLDGRVILTLASVTNQEDFDNALSAGADALVVSLGELLDGDGEDEEQYSSLVSLCSWAGGKPLVIVSSVADLSVRALLRAAVVGDISWRIIVGDDPSLDIPAVIEYINQEREALIAEEIAIGRPSFGIAISNAERAFAEADLLGIDRVTVALSGGSLETLEQEIAWLSDLSDVLRPWMIPLEADVSRIEGRFEDWQPTLQFGAVAGYIVRPSDIWAMKAAIRNTYILHCPKVSYYS